MALCPRCGRGHSGLCGIPAGVTLGFGARLGGVRNPRRSDHPIKGKPKQTRRSATVLNGLLSEAQRQMEKVTELLRILPSDLPEYAGLLDSEARLAAYIKQLVGQIATRKGD